MEVVRDLHARVATAIIPNEGRALRLSMRMAGVDTGALI